MPMQHWRNIHVQKFGVGKIFEKTNENVHIQQVCF